MSDVRWSYSLSLYERRVAIGVARMRSEDNDGSTQTASQDRDGGARFEQDCVACFAEVAASRLLNLAWTGMSRREPDVGGVLEVRSVRDPTRRLTARATDVHPNRPVALVYVDEGERCHAMGWQQFHVIRSLGVLRGNDGGAPYHLLSNQHLRGMDELLPWLWTFTDATGAISVQQIDG